MAIRKDANTLTTNERQEFVDAVLELKASGIYDLFVLRHANAIMSAIHRCPAFLPWHRRYIWDFERELQRVSGNPDLGLPYWNWPQGGESASLWDPDLLGGDGQPGTDIVIDGPFRQGQWTVIDTSGNPAGPLTRAFGVEPWARSLPTQNEIDQVMGVTPYDTPNWNATSPSSFRNQLEGFDGPNLHNRGHGWVGGSMLPMTSPNDPVFFMNHCMVDKLWHEWQLRFPNQGYLPVNNGPFGQNLTDPMNNTPVGELDNRPIDVLNSSEIGIEYDQLMPGTPALTPAPTPAPGEEPVTEPVPEIIVNGEAINSRIDNAGEIDQYRFDVDEMASFTIETAGNSDTVMNLFGPDNNTNMIASNDDGGDNFNARISRNLGAGRYIAQVGLFSVNQTGDYSIRVSSTDGGGVVAAEIDIDGNPVDAAISADGESDLFRFQVTGEGIYTVQTSGTTDTFLTLYGPDSQSEQIATDDDSGVSRNSRIDAELVPGEYFARVRHYSRFGTGAYRISVSRN